MNIYEPDKTYLPTFHYVDEIVMRFHLPVKKLFPLDELALRNFAVQFYTQFLVWIFYLKPCVRQPRLILGTFCSWKDSPLLPYLCLKDRWQEENVFPTAQYECCVCTELWSHLSPKFIKAEAQC